MEQLRHARRVRRHGAEVGHSRRGSRAGGPDPVRGRRRFGRGRARQSRPDVRDLPATRAGRHRGARRRVSRRAAARRLAGRRSPARRRGEPAAADRRLRRHPLRPARTAGRGRGGAGRRASRCTPTGETLKAIRAPAVSAGLRAHVRRVRFRPGVGGVRTLPLLRHAGEGRHLTTPAAEPDEPRTIPSEWRRRQDEQAVAYHFLGRCFYEEPRADWLAAFARDRLFEAWPFPSDDANTAGGLVLLAAFCERWDPAQLAALVWDFNRLFVGPGEMLAAPWESIYRSKKKLTFQESTLQVRALYERFGVEAPAVHREPDDHLGLELAFVATLSELAAQGDAAQLARCFEAQTGFLRDHLLAWAPACLALVEKHAETDYYRGAARLALGSLSESARICKLHSE
ncbi:MAG: molecular chaperone [Acidobacteria bacterium]|nr:molecular chaperone [Acidobacteriota bacterium]MYJ03806.1 molecular chaperone [Acidobacteriota bacterium]